MTSGRAAAAPICPRASAATLRMYPFSSRRPSTRAWMTSGRAAAAPICPRASAATLRMYPFSSRRPSTRAWMTSGRAATFPANPRARAAARRTSSSSSSSRRRSMRPWMTSGCLPVCSINPRASATTARTIRSSSRRYAKTTGRVSGRARTWPSCLRAIAVACCTLRFRPTRRSRMLAIVPIASRARNGSAWAQQSRCSRSSFSSPHQNFHAASTISIAHLPPIGCSAKTRRASAIRCRK